MTLILVFLFSYPFFSSVIKQPVINITEKHSLRNKSLIWDHFYLLSGFFLSFLMFIILLYLCVGDLLLSAVVFLFFVSIGFVFSLCLFFLLT